MIPYLINVTKENFTSCFFAKSINIIPANAPIGVKNAPKFDPIIVLYIAWFRNASFSILIIFEKRTLIGMLLIKFEEAKDVVPYFKINKSSPKNWEIISVIPCLFKAKTITNIEITKGLSKEQQMVTAPYSAISKDLKNGSVVTATEE